MNNHQMVFSKDINRGIFPQQQMHWSYFIDKYSLEQDYVTIKPLTLSFFLISIIQNNAITLYWSFLRVAYKVGFIDIPEATQFQWKYWRWQFWKPKWSEIKRGVKK
jgi:hypothetical protein